MNFVKANFLNSLFQKHPTAFLCLILCILTITTYCPVINYPFINYDDGDYVYANSRITSGLTTQNILWAFSLTRTESNPDKQYWHPLSRISHMIDVQLFGVDPHMHHMSSLFFHTLNTLLLFLVFFLMTRELWKCFFLAVLFALHPINIESVAWIAERKNLLFTTFWLITMLAYVFYAKRPSVGRYMTVLFALGLGLMTKPYIAVLPCALLLMDYWPLKRVRWNNNLNSNVNNKITPISVTTFLKTAPVKLLLEKIPLFMLSFAIIRISILTYQEKSQIIPFEIRPLLIRAENAIVSYVLYLYKIIWPVELAIFYPFPDSIPAWQSIGALFFLVAITVFFLSESKTKPYIGVGWLWFLGVLFPVIGLMVQTGRWPAMADRHAYVPLIGIFIIVAWGIPEIFSKWHYKKLILSVSTVFIITVLFLGTRAQLSFWSDTSTLFNRAIAVTRNNYLAYGLVGGELARKGDDKAAEKYFSAALRIKPDYMEAKKGLGELSLKNKNYDKALEYYHKALLLRPSDIEITFIIGELYLKTGHPDKAVDYFSDALALKPSDSEIYNKLGMAFFKKQSFDKARKNFETAVKINPAFDQAFFNLGLVASKQGNSDDAIRYYKKALSINPDYNDACKSLADIYFSKGDMTQAAKYYSNALRINPNDAVACFNIGVILFQQNNIKAAYEHFVRAVQIDPTYEKARIAMEMTRNRMEDKIVDPIQ